MNLPNETEVEKIHSITGGQSIGSRAIFELYGKTVHEDWVRFLDQEILMYSSG